MESRRLGWLAVAALAILLIYAWIDGGEEAVRPIAQPIDVPESAR